MAALVAAAAILMCAAPAFGVVGQPRSQQTCNRLTTPVPGLCPDNLDYDLYYKLSSDGGKTFGPATQLDTNPDPGLFRGRTVPATATADGIHVLWSNGGNSIDGHVFHYFAPNGGTAFSARQEMTDVPDDVFNAEAVGDGGNLYVYAQENGQINAYQFAASGPALTAGGGPSLVATGKSLPKAIRDVNGGFRMTMVDDSHYPTVDVYVDSSADGLNWPAPEQLEVSNPGISNWDPSLVQKPNGQYYLYFAPDAGDGSQRIALTKSNDFVRWTEDHTISPAEGGANYWDYWPEGFVRDNQIVLFYTSERAVNEQGTSYPTGTDHIWTVPASAASIIWARARSSRRRR